ncbi:T9SS type A sorting domain-containing protein [Flavilitoribacter nigricans]|uniref:Secretion system C-terminal sorting domain-containing protein n=1 Tax=Flavilitoribacter nigricans (strain ATCC 23147 / DSM 23189 / NBRC 102662 / NCIMB 1420 / SS-2) TaxID=1122177 RepID=A0A2D0NFL3_FLAN2|nr:T9SS type A sorting domain-containing protein [Flavilitoribacter nigricans]PHN06573.1 hypothetical protein CRP01_09720 [Flavilitoribacter nigricans DSM 23189 = NBRC 102662]
MIKFLSLPMVLLLFAIAFQSTVLPAQVNNKQLLVADFRLPKIVAYDLNGIRLDTIVMDSISIYSFMVLDEKRNKIYRTHKIEGENPWEIESIDLSTGGREPLLQYKGNSDDFYLDTFKDRIIFSYSTDNYILAYDIQKEQIDTLLQTDRRPYSFAILPKTHELIWTEGPGGSPNFKTHKIFSVDLNTQTQDLIYEHEDPIDRMVVDSLHQQLIFSARNGIYSISFDGTAYDTLYQFPSDHHPFALLLEPGTDYLYWTDYSIDEVRRGTIFGDPFTTIVDGLDTPTGIAFTCLNNSQYISCGSGSITASFNPELQAPGINIYPNPTAQSARLSIELREAQEVSVSIRSVQNAQPSYLIRRIYRPAGSWQFDLDTSVYPSGTYILTLETAIHRSSHKLVIVR